MIITIHGKDNFRGRKELEKIIKRYREKYAKGAGFRLFDSESAGKDLKSIKDFFHQTSIFKEPKLAVAERCLSFFDKSSFWKEISEAKNDLMVFFEKEEADKKKIASIEKYGKVYCFRPLVGAKLEAWVVGEIKTRGGQIGRQALLRLLELAGDDLLALSLEIDKLVCFKMNEEIALADVDAFIKPSIAWRENVFKAVDCAISGEKGKALGLMYELLDEGNSVFYLLSMISSQFRNLIIVKANRGNGLTGKSEIHPYVLRKSLFQAARFSFEDLKKDYGKILKADSDIKTGRIDSETALDLLLANLH